MPEKQNKFDKNPFAGEPWREFRPPTSSVSHYPGGNRVRSEIVIQEFPGENLPGRRTDRPKETNK